MAAGLLGTLGPSDVVSANIFGPDILIIGIAFLVLFGGKKFPEIAKGLGEGIRNFKGSMKESEDEKLEENKKA